MEIQNPNPVPKVINNTPPIEQTNPSLPKEKPNSKKRTFLLIGIVALLLLFVPGIVTYYLLAREGMSRGNVEETSVGLIKEEVDKSNFTEDPTDFAENTEEENTEKEIYKESTYTSTYYPSFSLKYPSSWQVSEELKDVFVDWAAPEMQDATEVHITLERDNYLLQITFFYEYPPFGFGPGGHCYYEDDKLDYVKIHQDLSRIFYEKTDYYGDLPVYMYSNLIDKDSEQWSEEVERCVDLTREEPPIATGIIGYKKLPESNSGELVSINLFENDGIKQEDIILEADEIVKSFSK